MKIIISVCLFCLCCLATEYKYNKYFIKYGKMYKIPPELLWGIAKTESDFKPTAINTNENGTQDIGIMQINTSHKDWLNLNHISLADLYNPEINIAVGSKILSNCINKYGFTYQSLNCYNSGFKKVDTSDYNLKVLCNIKDNRKIYTTRKYMILK